MHRLVVLRRDVRSLNAGLARQTQTRYHYRALFNDSY